ncbi:MAG: creatininase family protein, partial [bacterium]
MEGNVLDVHKLRPSQFRGLDRRRTVAVLPFAPIECHGEHLPLGTDYIAAGELFRSAAERFAEANPEWKFLFTPVIPLGADAVPHGGSLWVSAGVVRDVADEMTKRFIEYGFRFVALFSSHGGFGQTLAME